MYVGVCACMCMCVRSKSGVTILSLFFFFPSFGNCVTQNQSSHPSPLDSSSLLSTLSSLPSYVPGRQGREAGKAGWQLATSVAPCTQFPRRPSPRECEHKEKCSPYGAPTRAHHRRANVALSLAGKSPFFVVLLSPLSHSLSLSLRHFVI